MAKPKKWESAILNNSTYQFYYLRLKELAMNVFEWVNLPDTIDERFLELTLFEDGQAVFFRDEVLGYLTLQVAAGGRLNVYRIPTEREAITVTNYHAQLNENNSVLIYNNYLHTNENPHIDMYALRLYEITRAIDVNIKQQKTPLIIRCAESQRLSMKNLYMQYDGNEPFIFGDKSLDLDGVKVLNTNAPFIADKLQVLKRQIWNEALTYIGIENANSEKRERLVTDEVTSNLGGVYAQRLTRLNARKQACKQINDMFGLDIDVKFRSEIENVMTDDEYLEEIEGGEENE